MMICAFLCFIVSISYLSPYSHARFIAISLIAPNLLKLVRWQSSFRWGWAASASCVNLDCTREGWAASTSYVCSDRCARARRYGAHLLVLRPLACMSSQTHEALAATSWGGPAYLLTLYSSDCAQEFIFLGAGEPLFSENAAHFCFRPGSAGTRSSEDEFLSALGTEQGPN